MTKATVKITLPTDGEIELRPTLAGMEYLAKQGDNFQAVYAKLGSMNFDMYAHVIIAGLSHLQKPPSLNSVKAEVYEAGVIILMEPLIRFVTILLNGGKEPTPAEDEGEAKATNPEM